jgi:hypothetical protein
MKMKVFLGMIVCVLLFFRTAYSFPQAAPSSPEAPPTLAVSGPSNNSSILIDSTASGITIDVKNGFLIDVLQEVANQTDIRFNIASQLKHQKVNVSIIARDWDSGIESLTKGFSKVTVWDESSDMKEILLLGENHWNPHIDTATSASDNLEMSGRATDEGINDSRLSISKLQRLVQVPPGTSLPPGLFADQEIRRYLKLKGIHFPGEWKRPNKARAVLHMAKKELNRLLFAKQTKSRIN